MVPHRVEFKGKSRKVKEAMAYMNPVKLERAAAPVKGQTTKDSEERTIFQWLMGSSEAEQEKDKVWEINKLRLDETKLKAWFKTNYEGKGDVNYIPQISGDGKVRIDIAVNPDKGTPKEHITHPNSPFVALVAKARSYGSRALIKYYVAPDSFETYLIAREYSESQRIDAGWEIWNTDSLRGSQLRPVKELETWKYDLSKLPRADYLAASKAAGPKVAKKANDKLSSFKADEFQSS